ncbi:gp436 family protein [Kaistia sp. MMO-174]|uniref:gp436 family protein n=1 Tax=Kaistia sp. MMO-174 TaxID=3081256 RepID=UPI0030188283
MTYSTRADIEQLYGVPFLAAILPDQEADTAEPDQVANAAIEAATSQAASHIDSYLGVRYALPLGVVPDFLVSVSVDIIVYTLCNTHDRLTDEITKRYERAIAWLRDIAAGKAGLGQAEPSNAETGAGGPTGAAVFGRPRRNY